MGSLLAVGFLSFGFKHLIPGFEDEALGAVFAVFCGFVVFEDAEGFAGEVASVDIGGVEDVAEFVAGQAIEICIVGVEFGAEGGATFGVPDPGCAAVAHVLGEGLHVPGGVDEFEDAGGDEVDVGLSIGFGWENGELFYDEEVHVSSTDFVASYKVKHQ